eukprot:TRINITY_DN1410_c0_g1_i1.p1 TRINITY_DN1410_c0_g1~~TRINITY_DN1410_c0_g1_i1.p1  ORF type:complete len:168 (-),score=11.06 TRINITY_DN1410_c0_g1_i1:498-1001(-)
MYPRHEGASAPAGEFMIADIPAPRPRRVSLVGSCGLLELPSSMLRPSKKELQYHQYQKKVAAFHASRSKKNPAPAPPAQRSPSPPEQQSMPLLNVPSMLDDLAQGAPTSILLLLKEVEAKHHVGLSLPDQYPESPHQDIMQPHSCLIAAQGNYGHEMPLPLVGLGRV